MSFILLGLEAAYRSIGFELQLRDDGTFCAFYTQVLKSEFIT